MALIHPQKLKHRPYCEQDDRDHGVVATNPVLILSFVGLFFVMSMKPKETWVVIVLLAIAQLLLFATFDMWTMSHYSNRYLMTFVALLSVFTGNLSNAVVGKFLHGEPRTR